MSFYKRNLAFAKLAITTNLEYRFNYAVDALVSPSVVALIEITLWFAIFKMTNSIGGFGREYYLSYAIWSAFIARITVTWMYEFRMIEEIERGTINTVLTRPMSFFEYYMSQFLGYKLITTLISFVIPLIVAYGYELPTHWVRLPLTLFMVGLYLFFIQLVSFTLATLSFHLTRIHSFTMAKNLALWVGSGELFPLDLVPSPYREILLHLPFSCGVYIPVGYLTGRLGEVEMIRGFYVLMMGILVMSVVARWMWQKGLRAYSGTGA